MSIKSLAALATAALVPAAALLTAPGTAQAAAPATPVAAKVATKQACLTNEGICLAVPTSWKVTRATHRFPEVPGSELQTLTIGSRWTPEIIDASAGVGDIGGECIPEKGMWTKVLKTTPTRATDKFGSRLYAVAMIEKYDANHFVTVVALSPDRALRTTGTKPACTGFLSDYPAGKKTEILHIVSGGEHFYATEAAARASINSAAQRMAYNAIATAHR